MQYLPPLDKLISASHRTDTTILLWTKCTLEVLCRHFCNVLVPPGPKCAPLFDLIEASPFERLANSIVVTNIAQLPVCPCFLQCSIVGLEPDDLRDYCQMRSPADCILQRRRHMRLHLIDPMAVCPMYQLQAWTPPLHQQAIG